MNKTWTAFISPIIEFANQSFWKVFLIVATVNLCSTLIFNHLVWSEFVYLNEVGLSSPNESFIKATETRLMINLGVDFFSPIWLLIKAGIVSGFLYLGAYFLKVSTSLTELLKSILTAYLFVIFGDLIYSITLLYFFPPMMKNDILHFYPLSILSFLGTDSALNKYYFVLARVNAFQFLLILVLFLLLRERHLMSIKNSFILTFTYVLIYGLFLGLWLIFIT